MATASRLGSCFVALTISTACTSHVDREERVRAHREDEPAPEPSAPPQPPDPPSPPEREPVEIGPRTELANKPFVGALGELTGDGRPDVLALVHLDGAAGLVLLRGAADGSFSEGEPEPVAGSGLALGDFDGDGDLDALILDASSRPAYRVARNDGLGRFTIGERINIPGRYGGELRTAAIADLDGDGKLDAVVPLWDSLRILHGDGKAGFRPGEALALGRDPFDVAVGDLDSDGRLDLAATSGAGPGRDRDSYDSSGASAWIFRGEDRGFLRPIQVEIPGAEEIELADLDDEGGPELIVSDASGLTVIREPLGAITTERLTVASDGPLLVADILATKGLELLTPSAIQSRLHVLVGYPTARKRSYEAGNYVVGLFAARVSDEPGVRIVLLDAGPPGGMYGPPAPAVETLFVAGTGECYRCESLQTIRR